MMKDFVGNLYDYTYFALKANNVQINDGSENDITFSRE